MGERNPPGETLLRRKGQTMLLFFSFENKQIRFIKSKKEVS